MMDACKKSSLLILSMVALVLVADAAPNQEKFLSEEEHLELKRELNTINKPAIKSFRTEHGDILDCVDIHKQLAFDHPLLKNHTLQVKPKTVPEWITSKASRNGTFLQFLPKNIKCPIGTVIIKRTTKKDLINAQHLKSLGFKYPRNISLSSNGIDLAGHHSAVLEYRSINYGAKGNINLWDPVVTTPHQFSLAGMWIVRGPKEQINSIQGGWQVNQALYPNHSRLYAYWTADGYNKTGCFNTLCPGFVQVSTKIPLGLILQPISTYNGPQYEVDISIYQDRNTGHWWFVVRDQYIGYWPKSLFTARGLTDGASFVSWGGEVYSPWWEKSPPMGSGHFPEEGLKKSAYVNGIKVIDDEGRAFNPSDWNIKKYADHPQCYNVIFESGFEDPWARAIFFGGPGQCTF